MKHALLIGINYTGTDSELNGCINDVHAVRKTLIEKFGYKTENIVMLTDNTPNKPTTQNIINEISNLALKAISKPNSEFWIHYSGHGASIPDQNSDEADKMDEVILPIDFETSGIITDDKLHHLLSFFPKQTKCTCFFDCCHSGTILDLKYKYNSNGSEMIDNSKSRIKAKIFMISGCKDIQTSADFYNKKTHAWAGAMTTDFIKTLEENNYEISCVELLKRLRLNLRKDKFAQIPQMTSSFHIKSDTVFCTSDKSKSSAIIICD